MRRLLALGAASATLVASLLISPGAAQETQLTYSVREARAYTYRVSLSKEVIELARNLQPCDPEEDPYGCDDTQYEREPNCPGAVAIGPEGELPEVGPHAGTREVAGSAGDLAGPEEPPPLASPITLNRLVAVGSLSRLGPVLDAAGFASEGWVDLSGRQEPEAHTESDAFSANARPYEERCIPVEEGEVPDAHAHYLSRSSRRPETQHLAECFRRECQTGGWAIGSDVERAVSVVRLSERGGKIHGVVKASLQHATWGDGALGIDLLDTHVEFSSDGTPGGLQWSVRTTLAGGSVGDEPLALPPGEVVAVPGFQVGLAAPFVQAAGDGSALDIVAPGLYFATEQQTVYFGGAEVRATFGRGPVTPEPGGGVQGGGGGSGIGTTTGGGGFGGGAGGFGDAADGGTPGMSGATGVAAPGEETQALPPAVEVERIRTGTGAVLAALGLGLGFVLLLLVRWIGRYPWGRRLYRAQPFRTVDWIYRAFVKP